MLTKLSDKKFKPVFLKSLIEKQGDDEQYIIRGVFSTEDEDRQGDVLVQTGLDIKEFLLNPVVLFAHDHWQPAIGQVLELYLNADGNWEGAIKFAVNENPVARVVYQLYKGRYMRAFSYSFDALEIEYDHKNDRNIIKRSILYELSCVNVAAVAMALAKSKGIDTAPLERYQKYQARVREAILEKSVACRLEGESEQECVSRKIPELIDEGYDQEQASAIAYSVCGKRCGQDKEKSVVPYADHGIVSEDEEWDGPGEIVKCGDDLEKLKKICAWYNGEEPEVKSSYKLPHHKADGLKAVWKGVATAMAALLGARGGVDIPEKDKQGVYNHLAKHYKQFDKNVPELKSYINEDLVAKLTGSELKKIKEVKRTLTDVLKTSKNKKVAKKISVKDFNSAIRQMLKISKRIKIIKQK
ncbi:MAG: HK97 family phage prohead protease [Candidatus Pacebacteria bacterium]|nr:HK97 family phage prohead protease [Candidatus Paceibacterota bacterium]